MNNIPSVLLRLVLASLSSREITGTRRVASHWNKHARKLIRKELCSSELVVRYGDCFDLNFVERFCCGYWIMRAPPLAGLVRLCLRDTRLEDEIHLLTFIPEHPLLRTLLLEYTCTGNCSVIKEPGKLQNRAWCPVAWADLEPRFARAFRTLSVFVWLGVATRHCHGFWNNQEVMRPVVR
jgi:hypothetical protein